ncbi:MAG: Kup system potassium uptake protein, partial [Verrucomicrobiaceae bacterium]|nr:Kup system potassium uptake protein [Verrucomicrobiaceae bacterium]
MSDHKSSNSWSLALFALGVVYGDIGTSPLYAYRECLKHSPAEGLELGVLGPISLIFWSLTLMAMVKYLLTVTHATSQGEGGMFALLSLLRSRASDFGPKVLTAAMLIALFGSSLLYGDAMITPAISVLSAVEGLTELNPDLAKYVGPIAIGIIVALFAVQRHGTAKIGVAFGPIMILWFVFLAVIGLIHIGESTRVFLALSPHYGVEYLLLHGPHGIVIMGTVLLAVTGCEALYADIGHFSRPPLIRSWFWVVYPALTLNYLGQGALVLAHPAAAENPFFRMVPEVMLVPGLILATAATIIASQAMITGVFSLTQQAVQLGFLPRLKIVHTSKDVRGQIFMPQVNFLLLIACIVLILSFKSSSNLASAYGLAVCFSMLFTTILFFGVAWKVWNWPLWKALIPCLVFASVEIVYVLGSLTKFMDGAWFTLVVAIAVWVVMKTWIDGREILREAMMKGRLPVTHLIEELKKDRVIRVPGTAVFMSASAEGLPLSLLHHLKHNKALHKNVVLLSVRFEEE